MKKTLRLVTSIVVCTAILMGCSEKRPAVHKVERVPSSHKKTESRTDQFDVKAEIIKYIDFIQDAKTDETEAIDALAAVTGANYIDDEEAYYAINHKVLPTYKKFMGSLKNYRTDSTVVNQINKKYIDGANNIYQGFLTYKSMIEQNAPEKEKTANAFFDRGTEDINQFKTMLQEACKKYDVPIRIADNDAVEY